MYNRYVPQPDGSFRRKSVPDPPPPKPAPKSEPQAEPRPVPTAAPISQPAPRRPALPPRRQPGKSESSLTGFFRQLLPPDLGTEDLIVVLLLLLMAGDSQEGQSNSLLTLALYLFL